MDSMKLSESIKVINRKSGAVGRSICIDFGFPVLLEGRACCSPLQVELGIAHEALNATGLVGRAIDTLIVVGSMPRLHTALISASVARCARMRVGRAVEMGGHCGSVLDVLHYCFGCLGRDETAIVLSLDSFSTSYRAASSGQDWIDGCGTLLVGPTGKLCVTLAGYASILDYEYIGIAHEFGQEVVSPFRPKHLDGFSVADRKNIMDLVATTLSMAAISLSDVCAVAVVNRSERSIEWLSSWLPDGCLICHSRGDMSHAGGVDLITNLERAAMHVLDGYVLALGTGLGYTWQSMLLQVKHEDRVSC